MNVPLRIGSVANTPSPVRERPTRNGPWPLSLPLWLPAPLAFAAPLGFAARFLRAAFCGAVLVRELRVAMPDQTAERDPGFHYLAIPRGVNRGARTRGVAPQLLL